MKHFSNWIAQHSMGIVIVSMFLLIPAILGYMGTRVNYDILVYLPEEIDTIKGEQILTDDFGLGAYAFVIVDTSSSYQVKQLTEKIANIDGVNQVVSAFDLLGTSIPYQMLPLEVLDKLVHGKETIMMVTFKGSTSEDATIKAVRTLGEMVDNKARVSSMTAMVIDTMDLSSEELMAYVVIAVIFCLVVLLVATDAYLVPFFLLLNIGVAILYNMGSNYLLGEISYITKAITAILQLGVTTDFSIFLYHKYEQAKQEDKDKKAAMARAICETFQSVIGSSLTTFAGFLALCTMDLTLGTDIGIVMAKGVLCGLVCVLTLFPSLLLVFDKQIEKTKHKNIFPKWKRIQHFSIKHDQLILVILALLFIPAVVGNSRYEVYYKLDDSLPADLSFQLANKDLKEKFNIVSPTILLFDKNLQQEKVASLEAELKSLSGVDLVLAPSALLNSGAKEMLPDTLLKILDHEKYQLCLVNSTYEIASDDLNEQVKMMEKIVKKYDKKGIVAGEGALMKDLVTIADHDFKMVNYTSLLVIFIIMMLVLKSFGLPILLIFTIEFAIFLNMAVPYYMGVRLPFIASIIVGTIQLGATIDYAILMSTKYLEERGRGVLKKKALEITLAQSVPAIITSAMCFFAATFGVAVYTKIDMIGSICELLARGSIISMFVVILFLPAILYACDPFILKTTKMKKEEIK